MDEPALVRVLERLGDLDHDLDRLFLVVPLVGRDVVVDRPPLDVLHHEVVDIALVAHIERLDDVGVVELGRGAALGEETLDELRI